MNLKSRDPRELAVDLLSRSVCAVQVASCIADRHGIFGWGHNHAGPDGMGEHAEVHCLSRSNIERARKPEAILYVAARRRRNGKTVTAKPCLACWRLVQSHSLLVVYRDADNVWQTLEH